MSPTIKHILTLAAIPLIVLAIYLGYTIITDSSPVGPQFSYLELQVVEPVIERGAKLLPRKAQYTEALAWVVSDKKEHAFQILKKAVAKDGKYNLVTPDEYQKDYDTFSFEAIKKLFEKEKERPTLIARLKTIETDGDIQAQLDVDFALPGEEPKSLTPIIESYKFSLFNLDYLGFSIQSTSAWMRLLIWLIAASLLPLALYPLIKKVVEKESNGYNALLLFAFTAFSGFLAFFLMGLSLGFFRFIILIAGMLASFIWITLVMNKIDQWRK